jgi:hypothetical protein
LLSRRLLTREEVREPAQVEQVDERPVRTFEPEVATAPAGGEGQARDGLDRREIRPIDRVRVADQAAGPPVKELVGSRAELVVTGRSEGEPGHVDRAAQRGGPRSGARVTGSRQLGQPETSGTGLHSQRPGNHPKLIGPAAVSSRPCPLAIAACTLAIAACTLALEARL